jgi:hypothetical protein
MIQNQLGKVDIMIKFQSNFTYPLVIAQINEFSS